MNKSVQNKNIRFELLIDTVILLITQGHSPGALQTQMDQRSCPLRKVGWLSPFRDLWPRRGAGRPELLLSFASLRRNTEKPRWSRSWGCGMATTGSHSHKNKDAKWALEFETQINQNGPFHLVIFRVDLPSLKSLLASSKTSVSLLLDGHSMSSRFSENKSKSNQQSAMACSRRLHKENPGNAVIHRGHKGKM